MSSTGSQPQFRYTQTPSKVLHVRNLPWECTEEELFELCKPFGKVVNTKVNVGANRNQAFVEFNDLNQAIAMVSYYASSSEPAQVRGKTVYVQYSNRQEVVNNKSSGDVESNVLLVTIEGVEAGDVSIDVLHLVFSAFGFVHKIATFEKTAGFQALVQFSDSTTASSARSALDGRSIPRYLLPEHVETCHLRISFSAHTDLNVKFQSHRSRDYTNPYLPVAPSAIDSSLSQNFTVGPDGKRKEPESNVLLASIENMQYAVTIDVIHTVFSAFGTVQKIAIFEKNGGFQALVQYPDIPTAVAAKEALEGHCIYDGGFCKLHLAYSRHTDLSVKGNNDRSRDYTLSNMASSQPPILGQAPLALMNASSVADGYHNFPTSASTAYGMNQFSGPGAVRRPPTDFVGTQPVHSWEYSQPPRAASLGHSINIGGLGAGLAGPLQNQLSSMGPPGSLPMRGVPGLDDFSAYARNQPVHNLGQSSMINNGAPIGQMGGTMLANIDGNQHFYPSVLDGKPQVIRSSLIEI
ncbi:hypothetical protein O6H91_18G082100 [Diphasiastrum complanatum]|uniref:Uncharacterized protein n=2 Tax=Diphasiastrum complanatum TaxID=34168 RepID=A0ACC2B352_DIPCM|nr:hypothetical protein O6H91_18G081600 [Diphasiastrum complanatum]KAJ7524202.1 hypothetical protein O6H91_18G082100 [Diphasiastrum complanatum]